uniref:Predicted protein n=1 Tax=Hordeum vulgare subsp. vulgare TaxID=112509 RepID=F2DF58_HORVV|nr:predicted protein [Hordeum vulgare subsp. vulgare]
MASITLGPVIGKTTSTTTRILIEADHDAEITCVLTPPSGAAVTQAVQFRKDHPRCFAFSGLTPDTPYTITFTGAKSDPSRSGRVRTYRADAQLSELRVVSLSCHSHLADIKDEPVVWNDLFTKFVGPGHIDLILHIGDQVYADVAYDQGLAFLNGRRDKGSHEPNYDTLDHVSDYYRQVYRKTWNYAPCARVLANVPSMMIWDDHDLRNDWGSRPNDCDPKTNDYWVGIAARMAFWEYQRQLWDDKLLDAAGKVTLPVTIRSHTEGSVHRFGDIGVAIIDTRGARSFDKDEKNHSFLSKVQWTQLKTALSPGGTFDGCKSILLAMSVAVCVCGTSISKLGGSVLKDKMGFGLFPGEQQEFIDLVDNWIDSKPGQRDCAFIGGDLHIGVKTEITRKGTPVCYQYLTSPIREHPPGGFAYSAFKAAMGTAEELKKGFAYKHLLFVPHRNFGVFEARGDKPSVRGIICFRDEKREMIDWWPGKFVISNIKCTSLASKDDNGLSDPFVVFNFLGKERKTSVVKKSLNPSWNETVELPFFHLNELLIENTSSKFDLALEIKVYDEDRFNNDFIGGAFLDVTSICAHPKDFRSNVRLLDDRTVQVTVKLASHKEHNSNKKVGITDVSGGNTPQGSISFTLTFVPLQG